MFKCKCCGTDLTYVLPLTKMGVVMCPNCLVCQVQPDDNEEEE